MKLLSIFLSLLVLLSSSTISLDAHYCSGSLQDLVLNKKAKSCSGHVTVENEENSKETCCSEKSVQKEAQKDLKNFSPLFELESFLDAVPYIFRIYTPLPVREKNSSYYYKPPLIKKDYQVLFEVFLI
ncbi:hypothetical protein RM549_19045 [Salegentibacter sp. F188]|uniref:Uncharacterized protein n=1 Tax=Autumnicola patrickiae TaxID=3075591 RepID=A0ABU3E7C5_9FLAO|nr:hypothetical protein [Salegentibacter sp. F188]MDT0691896.1 hypothetical protein [Salegentibacter sp. F188]